MKFFDQCKTREEAKARYRQLSKEHHPDLGGDVEVMKAINAEYDFISAKLLNGEELTEEQQEENRVYDEAYRVIIQQLVALPGILIEFVGTWIWVTGNTYPIKSKLKAAGLMFAGKKVAWYWRPESEKATRGSGKSLDEIKAKYGSEEVKGKGFKTNYINQ